MITLGRAQEQSKYLEKDTPSVNNELEMIIFCENVSEIKKWHKVDQFLHGFLNFEAPLLIPCWKIFSDFFLHCLVQFRVYEIWGNNSIGLFETNKKKFWLNYLILYQI